MSVFDKETFLGTSVDQEMETRRTPIPPGDYTAIIHGKDIRTPQDSTILEIFWEIIDHDELKEQLGLRDLRVNQSVFLDVLDDGTLKFGPNCNVQLGRLREAVGQNNSGTPWNFNMLDGAGPATIRIVHVPDKNDPEIIRDKVNRVSKLA